MTFQDNGNAIRWRVHLSSDRRKAFQTISTDAGRAGFWAESAEETGAVIHFRFVGGEEWQGRILRQIPETLFSVEYFGGSIATFELEDGPSGGTDLILTDEGVTEEDRVEVIAGWVSVLLALKARVDFSVDLRNHDPRRTWKQGYADN